MATQATKQKRERRLLIPVNLDEKICNEAQFNGIDPIDQIKMILTHHYNEDQNGSDEISEEAIQERG